MSRLPDRLILADLDAILDQATDPEREYRIAGWILRAMAAEIVAIRAGRKPRVRPKKAAPLPGQMDLPIFADSI